MSIQEALNTINHQLKGIYSENEILSLAYIILEHLLNYSKTDIIIYRDEVLESKQEDELFSIINRLRNEEPIQYIIGETEFYGLKFKLTSEVLIPRQETEELVNWIIKDNIENKSKLNILDIGTGSACIAICLAKHLKNSNVSAIDFKNSILDIARKNAKLNQVNIDFINLNILEESFFDKEFDIVVSNPPYIRDCEKALISKNVLNFEPETALFVPDNDPLLFYKAIIKLCKTNLKRNGILYLEINEALGKETKNLLTEYNFKNVEIRNDINDKPRMIKAIYEG